MTVIVADATTARILGSFCNILDSLWAVAILGENMRKLIVILSVVVMMLVLACVPGWAQGTAQISGTVTDNSGAVLAGATVTATQTDTGVARTTTSNETGSYVLPNLPIGPYKLEAVAKGFRTFAQTGIVLQVQGSAEINPQLQVGEVAQTIQVNENVPLVETQNQGVVGEIVENERILDLPLNGRNVNDLMALAGGTTPALNVQAVARDVFNANLTPIGIAGGVSYGVAYTLDGAMHNNPEDGLALAVPFPDALQEFKIETSAISAGSGGIHSSGLVSLATKSGTNSIHGDIFEFIRNYNLNARDPFATGPDHLERNQFGGVIGGPIKKDRMFFFAGYQGTLINQNNVNISGIVPTAAMLAGNWTIFTSPGCNGGRQITLKAPFVGNMISPSKYSPAAVAFASHLPQTTNPCGTVTYGNPIDSKEHQGLAKIDYHINDKQSIFVRYLIDDLNSPPPYQFDQNLLSASVNGTVGREQALTLSHTYILRPNIINVFRVTTNRSSDIRASNDTFNLCDLGAQLYCGFTAPSGVGGWADVEKMAVTGGIAANSSAGPTLTRVGGISDDVSWTHGNHQISFGAAVAYWATNWTGCINCSPTISFSGQTTGTGYSDLMLGDIATFTQSDENVINNYEWYIGPYVTDTWKVTRRLSATFGVRWEPYFPQVPWDGTSYNLSVAAILAGVKSSVLPNAAPGLTYPGDSQYPLSGKAVMNSQMGDVMPRVGLAWDVEGDGRTSVRASFGTFYDTVPTGFNMSTNSVPPFSGGKVNLNNVTLDHPWTAYPGGNPFPNTTGVNAVFPQFSPYPIESPDTKTPEVTQWNLSVQKQIRANWLVSLSYLGSNSIHLWMSDSVNPAVYMGLGPCSINGVNYNPCSSTANTNQRRVLSLLDPAAGQFYGYLTQLDASGTANYNGLIVSVQHRLSNDYTVSANYTWSRCISDSINNSISSGSGNSAYTVPNDPRADRGNCTTGAADIRHIFSLTSVLESPKFSNTTLRRIGTGWSLAPILKIQSGDHLTETTSTDVALNGIGSQRVSLITPFPYTFSGGTQYLNTSVFALPATGTFSNIPPGYVVGPGHWNIDLALHRDFSLGEARKIEVRAEAFNVTNHFEPQDPVVNFNSSQFGQITSDYGPRIMQFALKFTY